MKGRKLGEKKIVTSTEIDSLTAFPKKVSFPNISNLDRLSTNLLITKGVKFHNGEWILKGNTISQQIKLTFGESVLGLEIFSRVFRVSFRRKNFKAVLE